MDAASYYLNNWKIMKGCPNPTPPNLGLLLICVMAQLGAKVIQVHYDSIEESDFTTGPLQLKRAIDSFRLCHPALHTRAESRKGALMISHGLFKDIKMNNVLCC